MNKSWSQSLYDFLSLCALGNNTGDVISKTAWYNRTDDRWRWQNISFIFVFEGVDISRRVREKRRINVVKGTRSRSVSFSLMKKKPPPPSMYIRGSRFPFFLYPPRQNTSIIQFLSQQYKNQKKNEVEGNLISKRSDPYAARRWYANRLEDFGEIYIIF